MKVFVKPILAIVGFLWVIGVMFVGFYVVQKRQTTQSRADSSFCVQQGNLPLEVGEVCPVGTEETMITVAADPASSEVKCCRQIVVAPTRVPGETSSEPGSPVPVGGDELIPSKPDEMIITSSPDGTEETLQVNDDDSTPNTPNSPTLSCPALPKLDVTVTCLNCIDRAQ